MPGLNQETDASRSLREWYPIESSPEVFTRLAKAWGVDDRYSFVDVLSLDTEYLGSIDQPCHAVVLLFPDTPDIVTMRQKETCTPAADTDILWIPQVEIGHSCGTFALVHALGTLNISPVLKPFFDECRRTTPSDRTALFAANKDIYDGHHSVITAGQTIPKDTDWEECDHFLSFVYADVNGEKRMIEMDGNEPRTGPLDRGRASGSLLKDVANVVKDKYLPHAGSNIHFSMIALIG